MRIHSAASARSSTQWSGRQRCAPDHVTADLARAADWIIRLFHEENA